MKIKDLDRNEVYDLTEIKKDKVKFDLLKGWLRENDNWNSVNLLGLYNALDLHYSKELIGWYRDGELKPTKCALTLFDLDITGYQVDCTDLSKGQIEEMAEVVKGRGFILWNDSDCLIVSKNFYHFNYDGSDFGVYGERLDKTTITYDKFMELFGDKTDNSVWLQSDFGQYKLTEQGVVFHDDFDLELYKESCGLSKKPIEQAVEELADAFCEKEENTNDFKQITDSISSLLEYKNKKYGNSALEPLNIFTNKCKVGQRLDDKLARVKNSTELKKNDVADLIGYLILTCKENGWDNFDEFKD